MIKAYCADGRTLSIEAGVAVETLPDDVIWYDMIEPDRAEDAFMEARLGIDIPTRDDLKDIEPSSRLYIEGNATFMTASLVARADGSVPLLADVAFILTGNCLVTIRYHNPKAFALFIAAIHRIPGGCPSGQVMLVRLLETIVDRTAEILEQVVAKIDDLSLQVFSGKAGKRRQPNYLETRLKTVAGHYRLTAMTRDSLTSLSRLLTFLYTVPTVEAHKETRELCRTISRDIQSLSEHASFISGNITFLLDASLGLINIEQNTIIKIFSIASVVLLPPTLIASIYGMNFRFLPELDWTYGYPLALVAMIVSAAIPYVFSAGKAGFKGLYTPMPHSVEHATTKDQRTRRFLVLALGSVGVVYGDIGTSPLYAFREALRPIAVDGVMPEEVIGLISLMIWTLTIIVTFKYVLFLLRADNHGEGGTLSLLALLMKKSSGTRISVLFFLGIAGAALFIGDAMITPALSVLSAVEGLKLVTPAFNDYVVPIAVVLLLLMFAVQSQGTAAVSNFFGPITVVWFLAIGAGGLAHISDDYSILAACNPVNAIHFLFKEGFLGIVVLGAVFLTVTGAEALYADLGHFGRRPIQWAWFVLVFPALTLNYLGQGALVLKHPEAISDPFYLMFPEWALLPIVILATCATIIASQAVITGAFSLTSQAIHLGFLPRMAIFHTSETHTGQIYLPNVNTVLMFGVMALVFIFGSSESLATAYGISVTGAMVVTTILSFEFLRRRWNWSRLSATAVILPLLLLELFFLAANLLKIHDGGYVPVLIALFIILIMWTWRRGTAILHTKTRHTDIPLASFVKSIERKSDHAPVSVPGTAIFLTSDPESTPAALLHNIKHNHVLHAQNFILTIRTANTPRVPKEERVSMKPLSERFGLLEMNFGFMETQNVSQALGLFRKSGLKFDIMSTSFYLGRRKLVPDAQSGMPHWQDRLFIGLANAATDPSDYFRLPTNRVVELGSHVII